MKFESINIGNTELTRCCCHTIHTLQYTQNQYTHRIEIVQNFLHKHMSIYLRLNKKKIRDTTKEKRSLNFLSVWYRVICLINTYIMLLQIKKNKLYTFSKYDISLWCFKWDMSDVNRKNLDLFLDTYLLSWDYKIIKRKDTLLNFWTDFCKKFI